MQCVAQSTPMIAVGMTMLRRRTLAAWLRSKLSRHPGVAYSGAKSSQLNA